MENENEKERMIDMITLQDRVTSLPAEVVLLVVLLLDEKDIVRLWRV